MENFEKYWEPVYEYFKQDYPLIADDAIDWYPSAQFEITVKMKDKSRYSYHMLLHKITKISERKEGLMEEEWKVKFSENLKRIMKNRMMLQDELTEITGITQGMLSRYIGGRSIPNMYNARKIADGLQCSIEELYNI